jgi:hypothetical protein
VDVEAATYWIGWVRLVQLVAVFLVAIGVAAEFAGEWISRPLEKVIDHARELQITQLTNDTARLSAEGDLARKETAEAKLQLEHLRKLAGPRSLNHEVFIKELEGKPKAAVQIWYLPDSSDGWPFALRLRAALASAGWEVGESGPIPELDPKNMLARDTPRAMAAGGQPGGITVVGPGLDSPEVTPARALFMALAKSTELGMYGSTGSQLMPVPEGTLRVVIAAKPDVILPTKQ